MIRMGLDAKGVQQGIDKANSELKSFGASAERHLGGAAGHMGKLDEHTTRTKLHMAELVKTIASGDVERSVEQFAKLSRHLEGITKFVFGIGGAIVGGAFLAFFKIKEYLKEVNEELDKEGERAEKGYGKMTEAFATATKEGAKSAEDFKGHLAELAAAQETLKQKTDEAIKAMHEQQALQQETISARSGAEIASINLMEEEGTISPEKAIIARAAAKKRAEQEIEELKNQGVQNQQAALEAALATSQGALGTAKTSASDAEAAAFSSPEAIDRRRKIIGLPGEAADMRADLAARQKDLEAFRKKMEASDAYKDVDRLTTLSQQPMSTFQRENVRELLEEAKHRLEPQLEKQAEQEAAISKLTTAIAENEGLQIKLATEQDALTEKYKNAVKVLDTATEQTKQLGEALKAITDTVRLQGQYQPGIGAARSQQEAEQVNQELLKTNVGKAILGAQRIASDIQAGRPVSDGDMASLTMLESAVARRQVSPQTAEAMALASINAPGAFNAQAAILSTQFDMASRSPANAPFAAELKSLFDTLAARGTEANPTHTVIKTD